MQVRYAAQMTSGEAFFAHEDGYTITGSPGFETEISLTGLNDHLGTGTALPDVGFLHPWVHKVRRLRPTSNDYLYIVTDDKAHDLDAYNIVKMATAIGDGRVLIGTEHELHNVLWGGKVIDYVYDASYYANAEAMV